MTRPTRELNDVQHHVLDLAAENRARVWQPGERMRLAKQRAAQAARTTQSGNVYRFAVEAAALLILEAQQVDANLRALGMTPIAPDFDR